MIKLSNNHLFFISQSMCVILLLCAILLNIPWYLKFYIFPIASLSFMFYLATLRINETRNTILDQYYSLIENHADDKAWLNKELYELSKKSKYIVFNKIHKAKYEILRTYLETHPATEREIHSPVPNTPSPSFMEQPKPQVSLKDHVNQYNKELYNKVWQFLDGYITTTLTPFYTENDINTIKHSTFEFFINDRRSIPVTSRVAIPEYLSMQDIAHFFHNLSELMSYYKKLKQIDYFKYITCFMDLKDYDSQSLYGNSTRTSSSSIIPLYRISENNNPISDFVKKIKEEMPHNQRIIS